MADVETFLQIVEIHQLPMSKANIKIHNLYMSVEIIL